GISHALAAGLAGAFLLGAGTSLVYPTLLAAISDASHPDWRAAAPGGYPFLRGSRYPLRPPIRRLPPPLPNPPPPLTTVGAPPTRHLRAVGLGMQGRTPPPPPGPGGIPSPDVTSPATRPARR